MTRVGSQDRHRKSGVHSHVSTNHHVRCRGRPRRRLSSLHTFHHAGTRRPAVDGHESHTGAAGRPADRRDDPGPEASADLQPALLQPGPGSGRKSRGQSHGPERLQLHHRRPSHRGHPVAGHPDLPAGQRRHGYPRRRLPPRAGSSGPTGRGRSRSTWATCSTSSSRRGRTRSYGDLA